MCVNKHGDWTHTVARWAGAEVSCWKQRCRLQLWISGQDNHFGCVRSQVTMVPMQQNVTFPFKNKPSNTGTEGGPFTQRRDIHVGTTFILWNPPCSWGQLAKALRPTKGTAMRTLSGFPYSQCTEHQALNYSQPGSSHCKLLTNFLAGLFHVTASNSGDLE